MFSFNESIPTSWNDDLEWNDDTPVTLRHFYAIKQAYMERVKFSTGLTDYDINDDFYRGLLPYKPKSFNTLVEACHWLYTDIVDFFSEPLARNQRGDKVVGSSGDGCVNITLAHDGYWFFPNIDTYENPVTKKYDNAPVTSYNIWREAALSYISTQLNAYLDVGKGDTIQAKNRCVMRFLNQCKNFVSSAYRVFIPYLDIDYSAGGYYRRGCYGNFISSISEIVVRNDDELTDAYYRPSLLWRERCGWENDERDIFSYNATQYVNGIKYVHKGLLNAKLSVHYWMENTYLDSDEDIGFERLGGLPFTDRGWYTYDDELSHNSEIIITSDSLWGIDQTTPLSLRSYIEMYNSTQRGANIECGIDALMLDFYDVSENGFRF